MDAVLTAAESVSSKHKDITSRNASCMISNTHWAACTSVSTGALLGSLPPHSDPSSSCVPAYGQKLHVGNICLPVHADRKRKTHTRWQSYGGRTGPAPLSRGRCCTCPIRCVLTTENCSSNPHVHNMLIFPHCICHHSSRLDRALA